MRFDKAKGFIVDSFFALLLLLQTFSLYANAEDILTIRLESAFSGGNTLGLQGRYGEAGVAVLLPRFYSGVQVIFDAHGYLLQEKKMAGSVGGGIRIADRFFPCRLLGVNGFYDVRQTPYGTFQWVGLGFESLGPCFDFRLNGYFPEKYSSRLLELCVFDEYSAGYRAERREYERANLGCDGEVGFALGYIRYCRIYAGAGGYFYKRSAASEHVPGAMGRLELDFMQFFRVDFRVTYDQVYQTNVQGKVSLFLPFEVLCEYFVGARVACYDPCPIYTQPFRRDGAFYTSHSCCWDWNW